LQVVNNNAATQTGITLGSTDESAIAFADAGDARAGSITYNHGSDSMIFKNNGQNTRVTIKDGGDVDVTGSLKTNNLSGRNMIINGAFNIAQRGTSSSDTGFGSVDRFAISYGGQDQIIIGSQHALTSSDTGPWEAGFRYSFHIQNGDQSSGGADAGDYSRCYTNLEAQDLANSGWNYTSSSSYATLSFWVKSSVAQTFYGQIFSQDGTPQNFPFSTGALTANTWTKVAIKIPGGGNVQFDNNNKQGMVIYWWQFAGTNYTSSSATLNTWAGYSGGSRTPDYATTWWGTNNCTFELTGVQLEVGSIDTPFEHKSYTEELARCQRYYKKLGGRGVSGQPLVSLACQSSSLMRSGYEFIPEMRAAPSITSADIIGITNSNGSAGSPTLTVDPVSAQAGRINAENMSGLVQGDAGWLQSSATTGYIAFSAEL